MNKFQNLHHYFFNSLHINQCNSKLKNLLSGNRQGLVVTNRFSVFHVSVQHLALHCLPVSFGNFLPVQAVMKTDSVYKVINVFMKLKNIGYFLESILNKVF